MTRLLAGIAQALVTATVGRVLLSCRRAGWFANNLALMVGTRGLLVAGFSTVE